MPDYLTTQGFWLDHIAEETAHRHRACGEHGIPGAYCDRCDRPFHRLLSLDTQDPRLGMGMLGVPAVHLVLCFVCLPPERAYRLHPDSSIELLPVDPRDCVDWIPYDNYPLSFPPLPVALSALTPVEQAVLRQANLAFPQLDDAYEEHPDLDMRAQVGGEPFLIQQYSRVNCPMCGGQMPLFAALDDSNGTEQGFANNCGLQYLFHLCPDCAVVHAVVNSD